MEDPERERERERERDERGSCPKFAFLHQCSYYFWWSVKSSGCNWGGLWDQSKVTLNRSSDDSLNIHLGFFWSIQDQSRSNLGPFLRKRNIWGPRYAMKRREAGGSGRMSNALSKTVSKADSNTTSNELFRNDINRSNNWMNWLIDGIICELEALLNQLNHYINRFNPPTAACQGH